MQWGHNKSCEELYGGLIHLCVKENKTVPLLDWHILAVVRKEKYGLQSWLASLVKICQEMLQTMQWLNWTCVTGSTLLPEWRLLRVMLCLSPCQRSLGMHKHTLGISSQTHFCSTLFVCKGERSICQTMLEEEKPIEAVWHKFLPETDEH